MNELKEDLKTQNFKNIYLLYGDEAYLKRYYKNQFRTKVVPPDDTMNYAYFDKDSYSAEEVIGISETMPFFADRRLVIAENTGVFKSADEKMAEYVEHIPETTVLIFIEDAIDKRNRMYKAVSKKGRAVEIGAPTESDFKTWVGRYISKNNTNMTNDAYNLFVSKVGINLESAEKELEKLIFYTQGRDVVTADDVEAVCTDRTENKIFDMIEDIVGRRAKQALDRYYDLLTLKEPPMRILFLIGRQFDKLLKVKILRNAGFSAKDIASKIKDPDWLVRKSLAMADKYSEEALKECVTRCVDTEESVKTGALNDRLSVEILITELSKGL